MKNLWYVANTGTHQGLIVEETTGKNIAVSYDKKDAPILAAAPKMLKALHQAQKTIIEMQALLNTLGAGYGAGLTHRMISDAITETEGQ